MTLAAGWVCREGAECRCLGATTRSKQILVVKVQVGLGAAGATLGATLPLVAWRRDHSRSVWDGRL